MAKRGLTKGEVHKNLEELANIYVEGMKGKERMRTRALLLGMLHKAAWYGAQCATRSAEMATDRLFEPDWLGLERKDSATKTPQGE